ncbi:hypothetical protein Tcan_11059 [Toxocara canis]|uniref:Uncharacterized protein n=1 Tax=Toxocara canis TaxID=6265 RepID=A0A0B2URD5_TOXCA|nr:hypothetical protein Tcan_11059 [Toxocara canis]
MPTTTIPVETAPISSVTTRTATEALLLSDNRAPEQPRAPHEHIHISANGILHAKTALHGVAERVPVGAAGHY